MDDASTENRAATGKRSCGSSAALNLTAVRGETAAKTNDVDVAPATVATIQMVIHAISLIPFPLESNANKTTTVFQMHIAIQMLSTASAPASLVTLTLMAHVSAVVQRGTMLILAKMTAVLNAQATHTRHHQSTAAQHAPLRPHAVKESAFL